jgi:WD40-like Beta Propeller Repeat
MTRCRRTDAILDLVSDPVDGVDALGPEQREHVAVCPDCHAAVEAVVELDRALAADLRGLRREELPTSILDTPAVPRVAASPTGPPMLLAAAAVLALAVIGVAGYGWLNGRGLGSGEATPTPAASAPAVPPSAAPSAATTPVPSAEPSPAPVASLTVGAIAAVVDDDLVVRTAPGTSDPRTILPDRLWIGQRVRVLDGPAVADEYTWWEIQVGDTIGWVADGEQDGSKPWLSPIGNGRIAYSRPFTGDETSPASVYSVNPDGSDERLLADPTSADAVRLVLSCGASPGPARWSHDGAWVAFDAPIPGCDGTTYVVRADGSGLRVVGPGRAPAWRPDGALLAFSEIADTFGDPNAAGPILAFDPRAGDDPAPLVEVEAGMTAYEPAWSPDRQTIAFNAWAAGAETDAEADVYLADGDGTNVRRLTDGASPTWSPDGRWIVFSVYDAATGANELRRIRPDGTGEEVIGPGDLPAFSPDGLLLAFVRDGQLWISASDGSDARSLDVPGGLGHAWSPDGTSLVLAGAMFQDDAVELHVATVDGTSVSPLGIEGQTPTWQPRLLDPRLPAE